MHIGIYLYQLCHNPLALDESQTTKIGISPSTVTKSAQGIRKF